MKELKVNLYNKEVLYRSEEGIYALSINGGAPLVMGEEEAVQALVSAVQDLGYWCQVAKDILPTDQFEEVNYAVNYNSEEKLNIDNVKVFRLNECDAVAAETVEQAKEWYLEKTGLSEEDAFYGEEPVEVPLSYEIWEDENRLKKQALKDVITESWKGEPFIAFTTEG